MDSCAILETTDALDMGLAPAWREIPLPDVSLEQGPGFKMRRDDERRFRWWRLGAACAVVLLGVVIVTPLCGALFGCGCTWPWAGLDHHCNVHDPHAPHHCPWCVRPEVAAVIFAAAASAGSVAAFFAPRRAGGRSLDLARRLLAGIGLYVAVSALGAFLAGRAAGYPRFLWW